MTRRKADADACNTVLSMLLVLLLADLFLPYQIDFLYARWAIHLVTCATRADEAPAHPELEFPHRGVPYHTRHDTSYSS